MQIANGDSFPVPTYLFIASEVRSGSTYVAELISYSLHASLGFEVWGLTKELLRDLHDHSTPSEIRKRISSLWLSPHNIRSSKVMCSNLSIMTRCARADSSLKDLVFGKDAKWIVVRRRNKIRQAVSLAVARKSGVYHSYDQEAVEAERVDVSVADVEDALRAVILSDEYLRLFSSIPSACVEVFYEDICQDPIGIVADALRKIGFLPTSQMLALGDVKLAPDRQTQKADLEFAFGQWLLENHHPILDPSPKIPNLRLPPGAFSSASSW